MSFTQTELTAFDHGEGQSKLPKNWGKKIGSGMGVFTATGGSSIAPHGMGLVIPKGAVVTRCIYKVLTTFTSATDAGTIALSIVAANDVVTATAINSGTTWDASIPIICVPVTATISTWLTTTADSELTATVAVEALTAGKLIVWCEWFYFGDQTLT